MAPAGRCKRPSALAMARIFFHALIITGGKEKVNQKYSFISFLVLPLRPAAEWAAPLKKPT
jgi:hypothetical protein